MKKQKPQTATVPLIEERVHVYNGIQVAVRIDYGKQQISLIETTQSHNNGRVGAKKWVFAEREIEYMHGWREILDAMRHAIDEAAQDLKAYLDEKEERELKQKIELDKAIAGE